MKLFWLDLESTGLDPAKDQILEFAIAEADLSDPFKIGLTLNGVFAAPPVEQLTPFIVDMHTKNGLLAECALPGRPTIAEVEQILLDRVPAEKEYENRPTLAGSSVHFDHAFLKTHMPTLAARFSHRHYDVSAVKLFCRSLGMAKPPVAEAHRAMADVMESIAHARLCARWLAESPRWPWAAQGLRVPLPQGEQR